MSVEKGNFTFLSRQNGRKCPWRQRETLPCWSNGKSKMHFYWKIGKLDSAPHRFRFVTKIFPLSFIRYLAFKNSEEEKRREKCIPSLYSLLTFQSNPRVLKIARGSLICSAQGSSRTAVKFAHLPSPAKLRDSCSHMSICIFLFWQTLNTTLV